MMTGEEMLLLEFIRAGQDGKRKYLECVNFFEKLLGMIVDVPHMAVRLQQQGQVQCTRVAEGYDVYESLSMQPITVDWNNIESSVKRDGGKVEFLARFRESIQPQIS
jgi:hypothetical protein